MSEFQALRSAVRFGGFPALDTCATDERRPPRGLAPQALRRSLAYMEAHMGERFSLGALAASAGISRFHFARLFRASTGYSPMEYLMRMRIERSKALLMRGDASICEIAALLGFCDQSHFTRTFRRAIGTPPRDFARAWSGRIHA